MKNFYDYQTPFCKIYIEAEGDYITRISFFEIIGKRCETPVIKDAFRQLEEYFCGRRKVFDLPLKLDGTPFQKSVWKALIKIPYGKTASYLDIAESIGNKNACRAVGMANNRNKIAIVIPCHRVIGKNGSLTGYAGGLDVKERLLELEKGFLSNYD